MMRRAPWIIAILVAAFLAGRLATRARPGLVASLVVLAGALAILSGALDNWGDWRHHYHRYLRSPRWHRLSWQVKRRDKWTCQRCRADEEWHMEAHHLRYQRWWAYALRLPEPRRNLVTLCRDCHAAVHDKEE